jgi:MFS family permease
MERKEEKEAKQLARYRKARAFQPGKGYLLLVVVLLVLASAIDEMGSNVNPDLQSCIVTEFLLPSAGSYNKAADEFGLLTTAASLFTVFSPFYKSLSDRFGRKFFLWFNVFGMALGMLLCYWSPNLPVYLIGFMISTFFISHDMQVVYVFEVAPEKKRATLYGLTKCIGTLSVVLRPLLRAAFVNGSDLGSWRKVFLIPACLGFLFAALILLLARETNVYLDSQIATLSKPYEQREKEKQEAKENKEKDSHKVGVFPAIRYIFATPVLRKIVLTQMVVGLSFAPLANYYTSILRDFQWQEIEISKALLPFSFIYAGSMLLCGILADHRGRKSVICACLGIDIVFFVLFLTGSRLSWNPYLVGVFMSLYRSSLFIAYDYLTLLASETCPTAIRGSVMGGQSLCTYLCVGAGLGIVSALMMNLLTGFACLIAGLPFSLAGFILSFFLLKNTKGVDLEKIS